MLYHVRCDSKTAAHNEVRSSIGQYYSRIANPTIPDDGMNEIGEKRARPVHYY